MKKFAVFDIDGTLIRWQLYHSIADNLARLGYMEPELYQSIKRARMAWKRRVEGKTFHDYEMEVIRIYEAAIDKLTAEQVNQAIEAAFDEYKDQAYTYTGELIINLKHKGYLIFAISGSQSEIVAKIAQHYGFDDFVGSDYEVKGGRFTGQKTIGARDKDKALKRLVKKHGAIMNGSYAIGDSHSDIAMLELVEHPVAFNPEKSLYEHAAGRGWKVVIERKNVSYELEKVDGRYILAKTNFR